MNIKLQKTNLDIALEKSDTLRGGLHDYKSPSPQLKKIHTITVDEKNDMTIQEP